MSKAKEVINKLSNIKEVSKLSDDQIKKHVKEIIKILDDVEKSASKLDKIYSSNEKFWNEFQPYEFGSKKMKEIIPVSIDEWIMNIRAFKKAWKKKL